MTKPHPSQALFKAVLASRRKDETLVALAKRRGVKLRTLYWWHQRFAKRAREQTPEPVPALVPVAGASLDLAAVLSPRFEVALQSSGHVVRVPARFEAGALRELVATLEGR